jgi:hypothetical protein
MLMRRSICLCALRITCATQLTTVAHDVTVRKAIIRSWAIHLRCLIEFFIPSVPTFYERNITLPTSVCGFGHAPD